MRVSALVKIPPVAAGAPSTLIFEDLPALEAAGGPLYIITVWGKGRSGKSSFLTALRRYLIDEGLVLASVDAAAGPFIVSGGYDPVTHGVDHLILPRVAGGFFVLLDTEGVGNAEGREGNMNAILALAFSSGGTHVCVNPGQLDDACIGCAGRVGVVGVEGTPVLLGGSPHAACLVPIGTRPSLHVIINKSERDAASQESDEAYVQRRLTDDEDGRLNAIRAVVRGVFAQPVAGYSVPSGGSLREADDGVRAAFARVARRIVASTSPAELNGSIITGAQYAARFRAIVEALNENLRLPRDARPLPIDPLAMIDTRLRAAASAALDVAVAPTESTSYRSAAAVRALCASYRSAVLAAYDNDAAPWAGIGGISVSIRGPVLESPLADLETRLVRADTSVGEQLASSATEPQTIDIGATFEREIDRTTATFGVFQRRQNQSRTVSTLKNGAINRGPWSDAGPSFEHQVSTRIDHPTIELRLKAAAAASLGIMVAPSESTSYRGSPAVRALCASYRTTVLAVYDRDSAPVASIGGIAATVRRTALEAPLTNLESRLVSADTIVGEQLASSVTESRTIDVGGEYQREIARKTRWHRLGYRDTVTAGHFKQRQNQSRTVTTLKNGRVNAGAWTNAGGQYEQQVGEHSWHE